MPATDASPSLAQYLLDNMPAPTTHEWMAARPEIKNQVGSALLAGAPLQKVYTWLSTHKEYPYTSAALREWAVKAGFYVAKDQPSGFKRGRPKKVAA